MNVTGNIHRKLLKVCQMFCSLETFWNIEWKTEFKNLFLTHDMALWEFWFLLDGSHLEKRRGVCRGKQSQLAKVKSQSILDIFWKIKENHIDSIADVYELKTASKDMKKPTKNVNKEIKQFHIANYIALQRKPSDFEKYTFMC